MREQEREILSKLAVMTKVGKQLIQRQGTQKPFGCLHVVFQKSREEELHEPRYSQLFDPEKDVLDEEVTERNNIRQELIACFEVSSAFPAVSSCNARSVVELSGAFCPWSFVQRCRTFGAKLFRRVSLFRSRCISIN